MPPDWLEFSGWTTAISNCGVATSGTAPSFLGVAHILELAMYTKYLPQLCTPSRRKHIIMSYISPAQGCQGRAPETPRPFNEWIQQKCQSQPQAGLSCTVYIYLARLAYIILSVHMYSFLLITLLIAFQFLKACRTADFALYWETINQLMPWVIALDHVIDHVHFDYARYLPVNLRDMVSLNGCHPDLYAQFQAGHFMGQKTQRSFSMLALDQLHEHLNDWLKNQSGTIGNQDDPRTVRREHVARPEMARMISELEDIADPCEHRHHEQFLQ